MIVQEVRLSMKRKIAEGVPKAVIARQHGVSRQSVYNILKGKNIREPVRRVSKLDAFKPYLDARLEEFDLPASSLHLELVERGYHGGLTLVKDYVRLAKGAQVTRLTERFETLPGCQAQLDWGECGIISDEAGVRRKLYVFTYVLGYSRILFARFTTSTKQPVLLTLLREALETLGCPRELLIDNMRQAVDSHVNGDVQFNKAFLDFCEHYEVQPIAAPPYWPRVKGKVEAGVKYIKKSFLTGRQFSTLADLNSQLDTWLDKVANIRVHGTTGERPIDRYADEVPELRLAAAAPRFDTRELLYRKVATDAHIRVNNVAYSVPATLFGSSVMIRATGLAPGDTLEVMHNSVSVVTHVIPARGERRVTLSEHAEQVRKLTRNRPTKPMKQFEQVLPPAEQSQLARDVIMPVVQVRSLAEYESFA